MTADSAPEPGQYARAGVDRARARTAQARVLELAEATRMPSLVSGGGPFASVWKLPPRLPKEPVLVSSTDSVGTKTKVAVAMGAHQGIGRDVVNHCLNDVLTSGATPLFFLDYFATDRIDQEVMGQLAAGMAEACREAGCTLAGGETAEMPGVYGLGDYDLAGFLVGLGSAPELLGAERVQPGDVLLGLPSSGLHTNGFSLVRHLLAERELGYDEVLPGTDRPLGELLLEPHRSYLREVAALRALGEVHALAHITGGGIVENLPRVLPEHVAARVDGASWRVPALFSAIQALGEIGEEEMWCTFNMGVGMICVVPPAAARLASSLERHGFFTMGEVVPREGPDRVVRS